MSLSPASIATLLVLAALGHFVTIPALAFAPSLGILERDDLRKLSPINRRIVLVVLASMQFVLLGTAATVLWARRELAEGGRLSIAILAFLAILWTARLIVQMVLYGPLFVGGVARKLHLGLVLLLSFLSAAYAFACLCAIRAG